MRAVGRAAGSAVLLAALLACGDSSTAPSIPASSTALHLVPVDSGFDFSVFIAAPPGDTTRLLVVERGGRVLLRKNGVRQDSAFLNLTGLTGLGHEYGVYSIAFHPEYATNRRLFAYYVDNNGDTRVAEFQADASFDHADPTPVRIILAQPQSATADLYGGDIAFGPDGRLYIALGDGDGGGDPLSQAQDSTSLLGKMLRIDVDSGDPYAVPADNPYVGRPGWRPEIWQLGLRNPWRWSFDRTTGDLWIGEVGQSAWEEIDFVPAAVLGGQNFGWPRMRETRATSPRPDARAPGSCSRSGNTFTRRRVRSWAATSIAARRTPRWTARVSMGTTVGDGSARCETTAARWSSLIRPSPRR